MIDVRLKTIGGPEIGAKLAQADSGIRDALRDELAQVGEEIVSRAASAAPKRTGIMASKITWFFGREVQRSRGRGKGKYRTVVDSATPSKYARKDYRQKYAGAIFFTVRPTGRVAHLIERGVNATFYQRTGLRGRGNFERAPIGPFMGQRVEGPQYRYERTQHVAPRPFFMPAVESVGGASGVNERLQRRLDFLAGSLGAS